MDAKDSLRFDFSHTSMPQRGTSPQQGVMGGMQVFGEKTSSFVLLACHLPKMICEKFIWGLSHIRIKIR
jgi:hypothetical protein